MQPQDQRLIRKWIASQGDLPTITLALDENQDSASLSDFCNRLQAVSPDLKIKKDRDEPFTAPALIIGHHQNIAYQAVPEGKVLEPFLAALSNSAPVEPAAGSYQERLEQIKHPLQLRLYIARQCPHCPKAVGALLPLAASSPLVRLAIIDAQLFTEKAEADQVRSVPTLIMDDRFRWTGNVDVAEILKLGVERDPAGMSADSLRQILESGEAAHAAAMMVEQNEIFPALMELLIHPRWSVRLGAMVTVEYLADEAPGLAADLALSLWQRFENLPAQVQGDVVHVLSISRSPSAHAYLQAIVKGAYDQDVVEAAREALE
jgi:glutaredoxin